jgi:copper chaperone CopZ
MKTVLKVSPEIEDEEISAIKSAIANNEGVIACEINVKKSEVSIVYDNDYVSEDTLIECIESIGYTSI